MLAFTKSLATRRSGSFLAKPLHRQLRKMTNMIPKIELTEQEGTLRKLLLDVSEYIGAKKGQQTPELRFTGGWVRDKLLGIASKDIDISISSMTGYAFGCSMKEFLESPKRAQIYGQDVLGSLSKIEANPEKSKQLETTTTKVLGLEIDLVNLRKEVYVEDSRNPTMEFGTPEEDALRRDATVNALFYNLTEDKIEDYTGRGLDDMQFKIIRTPLPPYQTFKDDPLRVLRCIRFASKLDYEIEAGAMECMGDLTIQEALQSKISRERVGIEIEKMLRGYKPQKALSLIDKLGLYETIFTDPIRPQIKSSGTAKWERVYNLLPSIANDTAAGPLKQLQSILLPDAEELYFGWLLCSLVPWSRSTFPGEQSSKAKPLPPAAAVVAREGLKTDNKATTIIRNAINYMSEIIASKDSISNRVSSPGQSSKRKPDIISRESLGMSIRHWGPHWRSNVILALLVQVFEAKNNEDIDEICKEYAAWSMLVKELDLLDAPSIKPIVDGKRIMEALGRKPGPWLSAAIDTAMEWQLANPKETNGEGALAAVAARFKEAKAG